MKRQVLTQKISVFIFIALLFISYATRAVAHGDLEFTEGESAIREIAENTPAGTNIGEPLGYSIGSLIDSCVSVSLSGPDAEAFDVVPVYRGAQLRTKSALDYETKDTYEVRVIVTGLTLWDWDAITVTISVTKVNEIPVFSEEMDAGVINHIYRFIPENTPVGINIGPPVSAIDPDGSELTYSLSGANADMFEIDTGTGQLRTKMPLDYEAFENDPRAYFVEVEVSDGTASSKTNVRIDIEPVNEFAPMFIEGDAATREIHEKEAVGTNVGEPLLATNMDAGETLEYSLADADTGAFEVDSQTGQLRTIAELDYESKSVHIVKVIVSDGSRTDTIIVTVHVLTDFVGVPDQSLAAMIHLTLGLAAEDGITETAMSTLTRLDAGPNSRLIGLGEIENLTGLEHAENLTTLLLGSNNVRDLTPLSGLTKLTRLEIYSNKVVFLTPLEDLTNLKSLNLSHNQISDITPLKNLTNLTELFLHVNGIKDVTPLMGLTNLTKLSLIGNQITDMTPLEGLTADIDIDVPSGSAPIMHDNGTGSILDPAVLKTLDRKALQGHLQELRAESDGSLKYQRAIAVIEKMLASMRPAKTMLLANYPNPFNPETWIPYQLGKDANVQIPIYNARGTVIRHLKLGHQSAGYYTSRSRAAYWDGKNDFGERVANGIYFYQLQADTVSPLRKMVILK